VHTTDRQFVEILPLRRLTTQWDEELLISERSFLRNLVVRSQIYETRFDSVQSISTVQQACLERRRLQYSISPPNREQYMPIGSVAVFTALEDFLSNSPKYYEAILTQVES
jgi:hypothetical protein